jgi:hypothetical protein
VSRKNVDPRYAPAAMQKVEAANYLGIHPSTFDRHVRRELRCVYIGEIRVWLRDDLEGWLERNAYGPERIGAERTRPRTAVTAGGMAHGGVTP